MRLSLVKNCLISVLVATLGFGSANAKKMYRIYDENGNVYLSDQIPPNRVELKRETLSEKARVVDTVEKAKTPEQIKLQKRLEVLRKEQEKIVLKQASNDKVLLSTYRSLEDMNKAMENKLDAFDLEQKAIEGNIGRYELQLKRQQQQAADLERNDQKIPEKLMNDIASSKQQISAAKQELIQHNAEREKTEKEFKADMARFQFLTQQSSSIASKAGKSAAEKDAINALGLFTCDNSGQCENAWKYAGEFVAKYSTTSPDVATDKLIMYSAPVQDEDLSLSVSKMIGSDGAVQIFLDVRCKKSSIGEDVCVSDKVQNMRKAFAPYIESRLSSMQ